MNVLLDKKTKIIIVLLISSLLIAGILGAVLSGSLSPSGRCSINSSLLDPTGFVDSLLVGPFLDRFYSDSLLAPSKGLIMLPCPLSIAPFTDYIWPFFYFFVDLSFILFLFLIFQILFHKKIISHLLYRMGVGATLLGAVYFVLPMTIYALFFIVAIFAEFLD